MGVCRRLQCRGPALQQQLQARLERAARQVVPGCDANEPVLLVPCAADQLSPNSDERRLALNQHLDTALAAAECLNADPYSRAGLRHEFADRNPAAGEPDQPLAIINACTTCRGHCCSAGENHGLLDERFLAWRLQQDQELTAQNIREEYLRAVPDESVNGSCIFHGPRGCVLTRDERSSTCNDYLCTPLTAVGADEARLAAAVSQQSVRRIGIVTDGDRSEVSAAEA